MSSDEEDQVENEPVPSKKEKKGKGKGKGKGKKKKKKDAKLPKGMIANANGELVGVREYTLQQAIATNQEIQETAVQQEKDALEVIAALQKENDDRQSTIIQLQEELESSYQEWLKKEEELKEENEKKITELNSILGEKDAAFKVMQQEFAVIKDFRKKRHELMKELEHLKLELADTDKRHQDTITRLERKFFEDKIRLQKEANRKISELAAKAHEEAVINLEEASKEVYRENQKIAEALQYHVKESEELSKANQQLAAANRQLIEEKNLHNTIVKEKILQTKSQSTLIKDLNLKIQSMEHSLSHVVREFEHEREIIGNLAKKELNEVRQIVIKLKRRLEAKSQEMKHIRRLAQHILDQRTNLEVFFMESLELVRREIFIENELAKKQAEAEYNRQMRQAMFTKEYNFPAVQSFKSGIMKPPLPKLEQPKTDAINNKDKVDIKDLKWSDRERILRVLFAKMNGVAAAKEAEKVAAQKAKPEIHSYRGGEYPIGPATFAGSVGEKVDKIITIDDDHVEKTNIEEDESDAETAPEQTNVEIGFPEIKEPELPKPPPPTIEVPSFTLSVNDEEVRSTNEFTPLPPILVIEEE